MKNKFLLKKHSHPLIRIMLTFLFVIILPGNGYSQERTITGSVTDGVTGEPLLGVTVSIEGTTYGTVTDINGKYSLGNANADAVLVFSMIGYLPEHISAKDYSMFNIRLRLMKKTSDLTVS